MKIKIDLADNFIDVWNEEKEIWERYVKVGLEEEKKIPEKLESYISCGWNGTCKDLKRDELFEDLKKIGSKINEIIDFLKSKGDE